MKTINLHIPDDLDKQLSLLKGNVKSFILPAVKEKLEMNSHHQPKHELMEGYKVSTKFLKAGRYLSFQMI